ncbi:hypothetical protein [Catellatospora vulcania]|uniref:hypothetical protein n=1 Tax=Catellatospora vulcania TaxID=1460450 RepID=UPI0018B00F1A|nr:hypothetical protein [Catellatospora vulcania]
MKSTGIRITLAATAAAVGLALVIPGVSGAGARPDAAPARAADPAALATAAADRAADSG